VEWVVASPRARWQNVRMKTLDEIERAVEELPSAQKTELLLFVAQSLREE
jgi:DNA-directed RNA polymerase specialized sigma24 family protein